VAEPPMNVRCKQLRSQCNSLAFSVAKACPDDFPSVKDVHAEVNRRQNVPRGVENGQKWIEHNRGADGLNQRLEILRNMKEEYA